MADVRRAWPSPLAWAAAMLLAAILLLTGPATPGAAQTPEEDPFVAPTVTRSADGRTATDGTRTLTISKAADVDPAGEIISVTGSGYNEEKGVYIAFCRVPARNQIPTPCGGGVDLNGTTGAARWISSNTPSYAEGLTEGYTPGGGFAVALAVGPMINPETDCRVVACAIVTRNDHTRTSDRSQDIIIPVTFGEPRPAGTTPTPAPTSTPTAGTSPTPGASPTGTPTSSATETATPEPTPAPQLSSDGRSVTLDGRSLAVSLASGIADGETIEVTGSGFDPAAGVFVSLCAVDAGTGRLGPCAAGTGLSAWVSSDPPEYGRDLATPYGEGGGFTISIEVKPVIDARTDCRVVACVLGSRPDGVSGGDAPALLVPVTFAEPSSSAASPTPEATPTAAATETSTDTESSTGTGVSPLALAIGGIAVALAVAGGTFGVRRLRTPRPEGDTDA